MPLTDPKLAYMAARRATTLAELRRLEAIVVRSTNTALIYSFALHIPGADIAKLQCRVQQLARTHNDAKYAYLFARDVQGADIAALQRLVSRLDDHGWITAFRRFATR